MTLCVRDDDRTLVANLAKATRTGSVTSQAAHATSKPQVIWQVCAKSDCTRLIEILDTYPLRGRKSYDYAIWRAAVRFWVGDDPTRYEKNRDWEPMRYLKLQLSAARRFDPTRGPYEIREQHPPAKSDWNAYIAGLITADGSLTLVRNGRGYRSRSSHNTARRRPDASGNDLSTRARRDYLRSEPEARIPDRLLDGPRRLWSPKGHENARHPAASRTQASRIRDLAASSTRICLWAAADGGARPPWGVSTRTS